MTQDSLLTLDAAAARLSVSRATLYRMRDRAEIEFVKIGARTMVRETELARIIGRGSGGDMLPEDAARYDRPISLNEFVRLQNEDAARTLMADADTYCHSDVEAAAGLSAGPAPAGRRGNSK